MMKYKTRRSLAAAMANEFFDTETRMFEGELKISWIQKNSVCEGEVFQLVSERERF